MCGDFNSHNIIWGSLNTDANGLIIEELLELNFLVYVMIGRGTRYGCNRNLECFRFNSGVKCNSWNYFSWEVLSDSSMGSNHFPIIISVGTEVGKEEEMQIPRWKLNRANCYLLKYIASGEVIN